MFPTPNLVTTSDLLPRLLVLLASLLCNLLTHPNTLLALQSLLNKPVTQVLLVKTRLTTAKLVGILGPEPGRIGGQDFVCQHDLVGLQVQSEFELRVCDDDAAFEGVGVGGLVELDRQGGDCGSVGFADDFNGCSKTQLVRTGAWNYPREGMRTLVWVNVLIVLALLSLGARSVDRSIGEGLALLQPGSNLDTMHSTRLLVFLPRRTGNVSTNNSLNRKNLQLAHLHAPVLEHRPQRLGDLRREIESEEMRAQRGNGLGQGLEPRSCAESQEDAFVRNTLSKSSH